MIRSIYAAGPIDAVTIQEARDWQDHLASLLPDVVIFSPAHPFRNPAFHHAKFIDEINRQAIRSADALVAYIPADRPAFGTIREIECSITLGKPTILVASHIKSFLTYDMVVLPDLLAAALYITRYNEDRSNCHNVIKG